MPHGLLGLSLKGQWYERESPATQIACLRIFHRLRFSVRTEIQGFTYVCVCCSAICCGVPVSGRAVLCAAMYAVLRFMRHCTNCGRPQRITHTTPQHNMAWHTSAYDPRHSTTLRGTKHLCHVLWLFCNMLSACHVVFALVCHIVPLCGVLLTTFHHPAQNNFSAIPHFTPLKNPTPPDPSQDQLSDIPCVPANWATQSAAQRTMASSEAANPRPMKMEPGLPQAAMLPGVPGFPNPAQVLDVGVVWVAVAPLPSTCSIHEPDTPCVGQEVCVLHTK